jgi:hypothetical protein
MRGSTLLGWSVTAGKPKSLGRSWRHYRGAITARTIAKEWLTGLPAGLSAGDAWQCQQSLQDTVGVNCHDPLLQRLVSAAIADAIDERQRLLDEPT